MPERQRRFNIEELTKSQLLLSWVCLFVTFSLTLLVAGFFAPAQIFERHCQRWYRGDEDNEDSPVTPLQFLINRDVIVHDSPRFDNWNQEFYFSINIYRRPKYSKNEGKIGFDITPFRLYILDVENISSVDTVDWSQQKDYTRHLKCDYRDLNSTACPTPDMGARCVEKGRGAPEPDESTLMCGICRINLAHETFISLDKPYYKIALKVANEETRKWAGLMEKDIYIIETMYKYPSEAFTLFEVYFRYFLVFVSITVAMVFWVQNRVYHPWNAWALEQKWTFILLLALILFNNPLFMLNIYAEHWLFPFLGIFFYNNYLIVYMLCILLFTDNLYKSHRRLSNFEFYTPKLVLAGLLWITGIASFAITRSKEKGDIAQNDIDNVEMHGIPIFRYITTILVVWYWLWLLYLIIRVVGQWTHDNFQTHIPRRIKFLWFTAICMLGMIVAGIYELILSRNDFMEAIEFFGFFSAYNLYTYFLSFMYWPVGPQSMGHHFQAPRALVPMAGDDMDNIFDEEEDI